MPSRYPGFKEGLNSRGLVPQDAPEQTPPFKDDATFNRACEVAGVEPTRRQYSKWLRKLGAAYKFGRTPPTEEM